MIQEQFIRETIHAHYLMQLGSYVSELVALPTARLAFTHRFPSIWYNSAYDIRSHPDDVEQQLNQIETLMAKRNRNPAIYVSPATKPANLGEVLTARGYQAVETESWTICDLSQAAPFRSLPPDITIDTVQTEEDFAVFADVYRRGYPSDDVELKIQTCYDAFRAQNPLIDIRYFIGRYKGEPGSMLTSWHLGKYSGIGSLAMLQTFQGTGLANAIMQQARTLAAQNGAAYQFGQVVAGIPAESFYNYLGYRSLYTRTAYTKEIGE